MAAVPLKSLGPWLRCRQRPEANDAVERGRGPRPPPRHARPGSRGFAGPPGCLVRSSLRPRAPRMSRGGGQRSGRTGHPWGSCCFPGWLLPHSGYNVGDSFGGTVREEAAKHPAFCGSLPNLPHPHGRSSQLILKREAADYSPWAKCSPSVL